MKKIAVVTVIIIAVLFLSVVWYAVINNQNENSRNPTPSPTLTPAPSTAPPATVVANINVTQHRDVPNQLPYTGVYLVITGTVLNNSTNNAYNVGLKVFAKAVVIAYWRTVIDVTVPIASGTYKTDTSYTLSTLTPYQSVDFEIKIYPDSQSQEPDLQNANVTIVWSNYP